MKAWKKFWNDEKGLGTIEILLILVALIVIAVAFGNKILEWFNNLLNSGEKELEKSNVTK